MRAFRDCWVSLTLMCLEENWCHKDLSRGNWTLVRSLLIVDRVGATFAWVALSLAIISAFIPQALDSFLFTLSGYFDTTIYFQIRKKFPGNHLNSSLRSLLERFPYWIYSPVCAIDNPGFWIRKVLDTVFVEAGYLYMEGLLICSGMANQITSKFCGEIC